LFTFRRVQYVYITIVIGCWQKKSYLNKSVMYVRTSSQGASIETTRWRGWGFAVMFVGCCFFHFFFLPLSRSGSINYSIRCLASWLSVPTQRKRPRPPSSAATCRRAHTRHMTRSTTKTYTARYTPVPHPKGEPSSRIGNPARHQSPISQYLPSPLRVFWPLRRTLAT